MGVVQGELAIRHSGPKRILFAVPLVDEISCSAILPMFYVIGAHSRIFSQVGHAEVSDVLASHKPRATPSQA